MPFGYRLASDRRLVPVQEQLDLVDDMARLRADGASLRQIAAAMRGRGAELSHVTVGKLLKARTA